MSRPVIRIENLGKQYYLGREAYRHQTLRGAISEFARSPLRRLRHLAERGDGNEAFWAVRNLEFEVERGEVVGIVGRNGAGKSTLLKLLSRITEPTEGRAVLRGRVASLLEVGTGFHPELTGRENVYLNGSILGMRKAEIDGKFDQIVAFAEIEKFLDTPVKHYSSGMYVRLAFAVAAHLEPEILIVDEVLAVGDSQFQKKCLGKMKDVASGDGRTVIFVSHNMAAVRSLCDSCCVLENGRLTMRGDADECVGAYLSKTMGIGCKSEAVFERPGRASPWMTSATLLCDGVQSTTLAMGGRLAVEIRFASETAIQHPRVGLVVSTSEGELLLNANNRFLPSGEFVPAVKEGVIRCDLGVVPLVAKQYFVSLFLGDLVHDSHVEHASLSFEVVEQDVWGLGRVPSAKASLMWWPVRFELGGGRG